MSRSFPVTGLSQIIGNLSAIGKRIETQAVRSGLTAGAAVIRDEARQNAKGRIAKAVVSGSPRKNEDGTYSIRVYVDERKPGGFLGYLMEYGVAPHLIARTGAGLGRVAIRKAKEGRATVKTGVMKIGDRYVSGIISHPGHDAFPFMRPALDKRGEDAVQAFRAKVVAVVEGKTGFNLAAGLDETA